MTSSVKWLLIGNLVALLGWAGVVVKIKLERSADPATAPVAPVVEQNGPTPAPPVVVARAPDAAIGGLVATLAPDAGTAAVEAGNFVTIDSEPPGARVMERGQTIGRTPLVVPRPAQGQTTVMVAKSGYRASVVTITPRTPDRVTVRLAEEEYEEESPGSSMPSLPPPP